ncbi:MAG: SGNH/GDSL hydrolase family protein, partial [Alphaproteobacteria bacterium]|nr:SGNH/GDSL hydrolase family protein [Alphaproteobacteria bacterium]
GLALALALMLFEAQAQAQTKAPSSAPFVVSDALCRTKNEFLKMDMPLPGFYLRMKGEEELRILAVGSSSTQGHGASKPEYAYPAQLQKELQRVRPDISVNNIGVGGTVARDAVDQLRLQLPSWQPHLVIWQVGANDAIRNVPLDEFESALNAGLNLLNEAGVETVLMPPQYAPMVAESKGLLSYLETINAAGKLHSVAIFRRYDITKLADDGKGGMKAYLIDDGLHHNDLGYRCLAQQLAASLMGGFE